METKTIKDRAFQYANKCYEYGSNHQSLMKGYEFGAKEQDRIARAEEREKCIQAAQSIVCRVHQCGCGTVFSPLTCDKAETCGWLKELRKAMEGGEG